MISSALFKLSDLFLGVYVFSYLYSLSAFFPLFLIYIFLRSDYYFSASGFAHLKVDSAVK